MEILLVDDLRSFVDGRAAEVARTSADGIARLAGYRERHLDELWLDHDLGGEDTVWPVVEVLERAARLRQVLEHWGYAVRPAADAPEVGYRAP